MNSWRGKPSIERYRSMIRDEAAKSNLNYWDVLGSSRERKNTRARFRVFRKLKLMGFSLPGIGSVAQKHHTTILLGIRAIDREEPITNSSPWLKVLQIRGEKGLHRVEIPEGAGFQGATRGSTKRNGSPLAQAAGVG